MKRSLTAILALLMVVVLILSACGPTPEPTEAPKEEAPTEVPVEAATEAPVEEAPEVEEMAPEGATPPSGYEGKTWADIMAEADGQTVNWYMWGGSDSINEWVNGFVADNMQERYGVEVNMVPVGDATEYINKVLNEKEAGKDTDGTVDLVWVNGENFRTMRQGDLLYGPWSLYMPSTAYVNWEDDSVANDFGFPVEGYESPYGKAQVVMIYDSAKVPEPPKTIDELVEWIKANPGKFAYPAPPDFTGSVFVRHICYWAAGGHEQFLGEFDQAVFDEKMPLCWEALNDLEPYLWREGETYPENATRVEDLFANGEVYFDMAYGPANASNLISQGKYPETTRTFVFDTGTIANTHYVAIPYNSPHKAGAMALANFLLSPEAQLDKAHPDVWGDLPAIDPALLPEDWQEKFNELPRGVATLPMDVLAAHRLPELQSPWLTAIEQGWEKHVLRDEPIPEAQPAPEEPPAAEGMPAGYEGKSWDDVVAEADGQTVNWYMWGGSDSINGWVTGFVADAMQERYGVEVNMVPVGDATEYINKVLNEKEAGKDTDGTVDLVWVNGENFRTMRQGDLLYGPWSLALPSTAYVNWEDDSVANDFGFPVEGYESPYGKAQVVMIYDSAKVPEPPKTIDELVEWIKANPGKFAYPAPPDFTGSVFVRHICYWAAGGHEQFLGEFDQAVFDEKMPLCWEALNDLEPYLWREGETYPENATRVEDLFANGEVYFDMAYGPANASNLISQGRYPETTRTFVFDTGTIGNTHYVAIPYNSPHKAGAMLLADFLLSPEAQLDKAHPDVWGDLPAIDPALLPEDWQQKFSELPRGVATLPMDVLAAHRLPELQSPWLIAIEQGWEENVLQK